MQTLCSRAETSLNECEVISQDVGVQVRKKIGVLSLVVPEIRPPEKKNRSSRSQNRAQNCCVLVPRAPSLAAFVLGRCSLLRASSSYFDLCSESKTPARVSICV